MLYRQDRSARKVAILMGTYNAQKFLERQLDSIAAQSWQEWSVWISDDGSRDESLSIIAAFQRKWGANRLVLLAGPQKGFAENFLSLVCNPTITADYYAYADQDDIWETDKLTRALDILRNNDEGLPAMYCSRTRLIDEFDRELGLSPLFTKQPSFANALTQSLGGGNTMIFNQAARKLLFEAGRVTVISHDWWTYLVVSGCGGCVIYDDYPSVRYRQHSNNLVGTNNGWRNKMIRARRLWRGEFKRWIDCNVLALQHISKKLKRENAWRLHQFIMARSIWLLPRLIVLKQSGIYRQTLLGNLGLIFAAIFKKV
ncbi:glycosyltransferase family 2 protein [Sodalis sp. dw_96]|uniref:glycosyltransferase family 2 protein n=1 Tax=Sodalis sp. dw_96 TaxID=2719794 RepID=UPI001BD34C4E|nr:glycosyltransferase family 2 protein [Sodalis sp. dw_96]